MEKNRLKLKEKTIREIFRPEIVSAESIDMRVASVLVVSIENCDF